MFISELNDDLMTRQFNSGHPFILRGPVGISKTQTIMQYCARMGLGLVTENLTSVDAPDLRGFLIPTKTDDGPVSVYSKPNWLRGIEAKIAEGFEQGILFFDEILSAEHLTIKAAAPLLSEGFIGDWVLPDGWVVWGSGNRTKDKAGAVKMLTHVANRCCILDVQPDVESLQAWMIDQDMHPMYVAFVAARPGVVCGGDIPKDTDQQQITPRSLSYAHDFHSIDPATDLETSPNVQAMVAAYIGDAATADLFGFLKTVEHLPKIEEIIADPMSAKLPADHRLDAQMAAIHLCIYHVDADNVDELFTYVCRLRKEMQASAAKAMIDKTKGSLLNSRALGQWISENPALITSTFA